MSVLPSSSDSHYTRPAVQLFFAFLVIVLMTLGFTKSSRAVNKVLPFRVGEKLTFQLKWSFIPVGEAVLEVLPPETINGVKSYHFVMHVRTYPFVDIFYKVRDRIDAYTDLNVTRSILYNKKQLEGRTKRDIVVNFDWEKKEAQYSNFGEKNKPVPILPGSFDPFSVFYAFRLHELEENAQIEAPVTDGKKSVIGRARVIRKEKVKLTSGTYDTYLVEPELKHIGGVFEKSKDAKLNIWVTADERRIPVKIESEVIVGSFVAELVSAEMSDPI